MIRFFDIIFSIIGLVILSPLFIVLYLLIRIESKGGGFYSQERIGKNGKPFKLYKFRSMRIGSDKKGLITIGEKDNRITKTGFILRKYKLDELPQLWNVFIGDMSLVGPRPERPFFVEKFREEIPRYMVKHQVRPGLTGWAQVNGYRGDTSIRKRIEYDLYYIENWSVGLDIKILFMTIFKGFINKNAY